MGAARYDGGMSDAATILDRYYLEMRWRCLSLAADLDRIGRAPGGVQLLQQDPRAQKLAEAIRILTEQHADRAEKVQMLLSDTTPPPSR